MTAQSDWRSSLRGPHPGLTSAIPPVLRMIPGQMIQGNREGLLQLRQALNLALSQDGSSTVNLVTGPIMVTLDANTESTSSDPQPIRESVGEDTAILDWLSQRSFQSVLYPDWQTRLRWGAFPNEQQQLGGTLRDAVRYAMTAEALLALQPSTA